LITLIYKKSNLCDRPTRQGREKKPCGYLAVAEVGGRYYCERCFLAYVKQHAPKKYEKAVEKCREVQIVRDSELFKHLEVEYAY